MDPRKDPMRTPVVEGCGAVTLLLTPDQVAAIRAALTTPGGPQ
jgi:hypothetical protein